MTERGLWDDTMKNQLLANHGSIQNIPGIPDDLKAIYKTVWEISQKVILDMAADRGAFIDQSQSLNIHMEKTNYGALSSMHFYGWKKGLKTGMYYLRTKPAANPIQFTVDKSKLLVKSGSPKTSPSKNGVTNRISGENGANGVENNENGDSVESTEEEENMATLVCSLNNPEGCDMCGA